MRKFFNLFLFVFPFAIAGSVLIVHKEPATAALMLLTIIAALSGFASSYLFTGPDGFRGRRLGPLMWLLTRPRVVDWLVERAKRTPYLHLDGYMMRWWLFNPYDPKTRAVRWPWLPSIRIHHILRADDDRHFHDHPWNARTVILRGWYLEGKESVPGVPNPEENPTWRYMLPGTTAPILFNTYHRISQVSEGGVFTMFITGPYMGDWGFKVGSRKVPHKEYLGLNGCDHTLAPVWRKYKDDARQCTQCGWVPGEGLAPLPPTPRCSSAPVERPEPVDGFSNDGVRWP